MKPDGRGCALGFKFLIRSPQRVAMATLMPMFVCTKLYLVEGRVIVWLLLYTINAYAAWCSDEELSPSFVAFFYRKRVAAYFRELRSIATI